MYTKLVFRRRDGKLLNDEEDRFMKAASEVFKDEWDFRHRSPLSSIFNRLVDHIIAKRCPWCGSSDLVQAPTPKGRLRRWRCLKDGKTFNIITRTIFDSPKLSFDEWLNFIVSVTGDVSFSSTSIAGKHAYKTIKYWMAKIFTILQNHPSNTVLSGDIYIDEFLIPLVSSAMKRDDSGRLIRGNSRNQINVVLAADSESVIGYVVGLGLSSEERICDLLKDHVQPGSNLYHDGTNCHNLLVSRLGLTCHSFLSSTTKRKNGPDDPLYRINRLSLLLREFLEAHDGFRRDELQGYLDFFCFMMNPPDDRERKAVELIKLGLMTRKVLRYHDYFKKLDDPSKHKVPDKLRDDYDKWIKS